MGRTELGAKCVCAGPHFIGSLSQVKTRERMSNGVKEKCPWKPVI